jgi:hypothetical protein
VCPRNEPFDRRRIHELMKLHHLALAHLDHIYNLRGNHFTRWIEEVHLAAVPPCSTPPVGSRGCSNLPSIRLLKAKQELVGVPAYRRVEHIFGVIIVLVCKN